MAEGGKRTGVGEAEGDVRQLEPRCRRHWVGSAVGIFLDRRCLRHWVGVERRRVVFVFLGCRCWA